MFVVTIEVTIVRSRTVPFQKSACSGLREQSLGSWGSSDVLSMSEPETLESRTPC